MIQTRSAHAGSRDCACRPLLSLGLALAPAIMALGAATQPEAGSPRDPLATKQQIIRDRMSQLEDRMYRLTEKLGATVPEQAKRLEAALRQTRELLIRRNMEESMALLESGKVSEASDRETAIIHDLERVLQTLMEDANQLKERREEMDQLRSAREKIKALLDAERQMKAQADSAPRLQQLLAAIHAAIARLQGIMDRQQQEIAKSTAAQPGDPSSAQTARDSQQQIRQETESLAQALHQSAGTQPSNGQPSAPKNTSQPKPSSAPAGGKPGQASTGEPSESDLQAGLQDAGSKTGEAAGKMKSAEKQLEKDSPAGALPDQKNAAQRLQAAMDQLKKQEEAARKQLDQAEAARKQRELRQKADRLAQQMQGGQQSDSGNGEPKDADQGGQQGGGGKKQPKSGGQQGQQSRPAQADSPSQQPIPGGKDVQDAGGHMEDAAQDLDKDKPSEAGQNQQKAIEKLEQAQRELEDALEQKRREEQEELLRGLESRFRAMLARQLIINKATEELDVKPRQSWIHSDELALAGHAQDESRLGDEAAQALHILKEDGTSIVFPLIVGQLQADMQDVAHRLTDKQTGEATRRVEASIAAALQELIDAIQELRKDLQNQQSGGSAGGSGDGNDPLLPNSAELKLLRSCQERVNRRTLELNKQLEGPEAEQARKSMTVLAERQKEVADMARKMNERITGQ
jgi:hypothetical protein